MVPTVTVKYANAFLSDIGTTLTVEEAATAITAIGAKAGIVF
jgi:hypothetical protein